jgi:hypothetical protein
MMKGYKLLFAGVNRSATNQIYSLDCRSWQRCWGDRIDRSKVSLYIEYLGILNIVYLL